MKCLRYLLFSFRVCATTEIDGWIQLDMESSADEVFVDGWLLVNDFAANMTLPIASTKSRLKLWRRSLPPPGKSYSDALDDTLRGFPHYIQSVIEADVKRSGLAMAYSGKYDWLETVLKAYSKRNPAVGYCLGMNYVAAQFIIIGFTPKEAFYGLAFLLERVALGYHSPGFSGFLDDVKLVENILDVHSPSISSSIRVLYGEGFQIVEMLMLDTSLSLFARSLPAHALLPVWDTIFVHGRRGLLAVSAALLIVFRGCFHDILIDDIFIKTVNCYSSAVSDLSHETLT